MSGDRLVRAEECGGSDLFPPRELLGDRFQIFFVESHATDFYGAIGLDEEDAVLKASYQTADPMDLLEALPDRS